MRTGGLLSQRRVLDYCAPEAYLEGHETRVYRWPVCGCHVVDCIPVRGREDCLGPCCVLVDHSPVCEGVRQSIQFFSMSLRRGELAYYLFSPFVQRSVFTLLPRQ